jgi:hypothetical protein
VSVRHSVVYGVCIKFTDLETITSVMSSSNESATSKSLTYLLSPCYVDLVHSTYETVLTAGRKMSTHSGAFPRQLLFYRWKKDRENLGAPSGQQFLANCRSVQGKQRVPNRTHEAFFLSACSPSLTHVVVLLLLFNFNYVKYFLHQYRYAWASVVSVEQPQMFRVIAMLFVLVYL